MSLLGNIASHAGRNLEQYTHNRIQHDQRQGLLQQQQNFQQQLQANEQSWMEGQAQKRHERAVELANMDFANKQQLLQSKYERDELLLNLRNQSEQANSQYEALGDAADRLTSNLEHLESQFQSLVEASSSGEMGMGDPAVLQERADELRGQIEALLANSNPDVIQRAQLQPRVDFLMARIAEINRLKRETEEAAAAEQSRREEDSAQRQANREQRVSQIVSGEDVFNFRF